MLVNIHHSIYDRIPPQGIYFEGLVQEAFRRVKKPFTVVTRTGLNQPTHDLVVESTRLSLKTETGIGTQARQINITKLCTTEREPWTANLLVERVLNHLMKYDVILMLRSIWGQELLHYQLLDIPVGLLQLIGSAELTVVGRRQGRQSLGADICDQGERLFRVHFDASDGKCSIRNLKLEHCQMLLEWDLQLRSL